MIKVLQAFIISIGLTAASGLQADQNGIYRWTDEQGVVQYSDRPPEGVEAVFIKTSSGKRTAPTSREGDTDTSPTATKASGPKSLEVMPEKDPALCEQAKRNLKALDGTRIRITEPDGTKRILTPDEKEGQRENAKKFMNVHC